MNNRGGATLGHASGVVVGFTPTPSRARLVETVGSLQAAGTGAGIVLLPDGPDAALSAALGPSQC